MSLPLLQLPESFNYIGLFLTFGCNLSCSYCINDPEQGNRRRAIFPFESDNSKRHLSPQEWAFGLSRIPVRPDLPITLQGGEPMLYYAGKGLGPLLAASPHKFDLLTNFALSPERFSSILDGQHDKLRRNCPYPSIRVSYHPLEMNRIWQGHGFEELVSRCEKLSDFGFSVSSVKSYSDVGIFMVDHPDNVVTAEMISLCRGRVPFETKQFLGVHNGTLYGKYLYPHSTDLITSGLSDNTLTCECRTTELLLDPLGFVWGCHFLLYESWSNGGPIAEFAELKDREFAFKKVKDYFLGQFGFAPVGHLLDPQFSMTDLEKFRICTHYGRCIGCDTKIKNDRFQSLFDKGLAHTSVEIRNIAFPDSLRAKLDN